MQSHTPILVGPMLVQYQYCCGEVGVTLAQPVLVYGIIMHIEVKTCGKHVIDCMQHHK